MNLSGRLPPRYDLKMFRKSLRRLLMTLTKLLGRVTRYVCTKRTPVWLVLCRPTYLMVVTRRKKILGTGQSLRPTDRVPLVTFM